MKRFLIFILCLVISIFLSAQKPSIGQYLQEGDTVGYVDYILELISNYKDDFPKDSLLYHLEHVISITQKQERLSDHFWAKKKLIDFQRTLNPDLNNIQDRTLALIAEIESYLPNDSLLEILSNTYQTRAYQFKYDGSPDTAILYSRKAIDLHQITKDSFHQVLSYETLAKSYERLANWDSCIAVSERGLEIVEDLISNDIFLFNRVMYAICLTKKGTSEEAIEQLDILEGELEKVNWEKKHYYAWLCKDVSLCYEILDRPRKALKMQRLYSEAISSGPRLKLEYDLEDLRKKYTDQAKENQILTLEIENQKS
ncbi:MAG: hypothetical protein AAF806_20100 [Bacteroidota bacterium]